VFGGDTKTNWNYLQLFVNKTNYTNSSGIEEMLAGNTAN
jgi:hypothetical protein